MWEDYILTLLQTVLGSLARNSITATSDTVSCHSAAVVGREREGPGQKKRRRRTWQPDSIEQVPFRYQPIEVVRSYLFVYKNYLKID